MVEQQLPDVARNLTLGLSVSSSDDLARFGVTETHVHMALGELARAVLIARGRVVYGGHLSEDGYTAFLTSEIERFGRRDRPFTGYVPYHVHRQMTKADIQDRIEKIGLSGRYEFLDPYGAVIDPVAGRSDDAEPVDRNTTRNALTSARRVIIAAVDGQATIGGRRDGFSGRMPGVIEETILAIQAQKPVFIAGGFGGAAGDMAVALGLDPDNWLQLAPFPSPYLAELISVAEEAAWTPATNGLTDDENHRLAITYRASEIASLIVTGLSRLTGCHDS